MKVKIIVRSTSITGIVLFLGAIVVLSNPGNLHADGPVALLEEKVISKDAETLEDYDAITMMHTLFKESIEETNESKKSRLQKLDESNKIHKAPADTQDALVASSIALVEE